ncbi:LysR family transcriptional regulator [Paraburkholderia silvatlantica]|uniref:DNA-binding transcriptional LysR family regulator n=1 Tax=Paraburkholderia silvatlantica TaxID=321895 RepID=A0ABR6FT74_9BURK|nr:LysR family transcriptional regulator [Paraburkholderia silvatlantica]MBB2930639.1 DNA-binding transcriptional LysR family regulator [Paraburkholderia silvatlantica]PVY30440.1 LysR family transcriptional regulator [Paraburkholderia silvatlantica]PXW36823.1 LysR family transcriptional regulator [Paraburkholderia silvatlantica]
MTSLDHVDLNLLRVFNAIIEERSLTRAGQRLALSQPAVSYALGRLRTLFDDPLFIRTRVGMQPTPIALELAGIVGRALDTVREALRYAERFDPRVSTRTFRLSLSDAGELAYLPPICEALHRLAPQVRLRIEPTPVEQIEEALRVSRLDFAIGNLPELAAHTRHRLLFDETYVCMTRRRRGLPRGPQIDLASFTAATHVQVLSVEHSHHALEDAFRANGVGRNTVLELPHFVALPSVLAVTGYYATLPRRLAQIFNRGGEFRIYDLPVELPGAAVTMHWHENFDGDEGNVWLRELMTDIVRTFDRLPDRRA